MKYQIWASGMDRGGSLLKEVVGPLLALVFGSSSSFDDRLTT